MAFSHSLIMTLLLVIAVAASPVEVYSDTVTLPIKKLQDTIGNIAQKDRARALSLKATGQKTSTYTPRQGDVPAINIGQAYTVSVGIGSPATQYTLLVDTGSSNTWVGANKSYNPTSSSKDTGDSVSVQYGSGYFDGEEYLDTVSLSESLVIPQQSIGVASESEGFSGGIDGILGIGPVDLTEGTVSGEFQVPTVTDNLFKEGAISEDLVAVYFAPTTSESDANGELTFGGTDSSKYTGAIHYTPITSTFPASEYWGIDASITYGSQNINILSSTAGIVDTGTTLILAATNAYQAYQAATGAIEDPTTGFLTITNAQYDKLETLYLNTDGESYAITPNAQIWPRALNTAIGGNADSIYLVVYDIGESSGSGLDFIAGYTFLERYYSVFDTGNQRVGFATTTYTDATSN